MLTKTCHVWIFADKEMYGLNAENDIVGLNADKDMYGLNVCSLADKDVNGFECLLPRCLFWPNNVIKSSVQRKCWCDYIMFIHGHVHVQQ